jgi:glutaredoxin 3
MERFTIGEVAKQAHVRIETLRYYERTELVACPPRSKSNYRLYPQETVRRVQFMGKETTMATKRTIEIFSAGCAACEETVTLVNRIACPSCDVTVLDMHNPEVVQRAKQLGIRTVPAVVINGTLAACCTGSGPDEATLRAAGLGQAL